MVDLGSLGHRGSVIDVAPWLARGTTTCSACGARWDRRPARWCGACGEALRPPTSSGAPRRGWPWAIGAAALIAVGATAVTVGPSTEPDRDPLADASPIEDATVAPPSGASDGDPPSDTSGEPEPEPGTTTPRAPDRTTCLAIADCVRWRIDRHGDAGLSGSFDELRIAVTDDGALVIDDHDLLAVHDVDDGELRWAIERPTAADRRTSTRTVIATDDLLVTGGADGGLVAHASDDGTERWRTGPLAINGVWEHAIDDDQLVVAGGTADATTSGGRTGVAAVAIALDDGAVRWEHVGDEAVVSDAGAVLLDDEGRLRGLDRDGRDRWVDQLDADAPAWMTIDGDVLGVSSDDTEHRTLHRVTDGRELELTGHVLTSTGDAAVIAAPDTTGLGGTLHLVEAGEVRWQLELPPDLAGPCEVTVLLTEVVIERCDGSGVVADRTDGAILEERPAFPADAPPDDWAPGTSTGPFRFGYDLDDGSGSTETSDLRVIDARDGTELAWAPGPNRTFEPQDARGPFARRGVAVIATATEVAALDLAVLDRDAAARGATASDTDDAILDESGNERDPLAADPRLRRGGPRTGPAITVQ